MSVEIWLMLKLYDANWGRNIFSSASVSRATVTAHESYFSELNHYKGIVDKL